MIARLLSVAQVALDRALRLDAQADVVLAPLDNKRIAVQVTGAVPASFLVEFSQGRILLAAHDEGADKDPGSSERFASAATRAAGSADVSIRGSASALAKLVQGDGVLPSSAQVSVHGDIALLQQARSVVARLRPDLDEPLARLLGDELAFPLSQAARRLASMARRSARELGDDLKEYLAEESDLLAAPESVRSFSDEVDHLRDTVARLDKRILRVASSLNRETS